MRFTLVVDMDNAAFDDEPASELVRVLHDVARQVADGAEPADLRDSNGNGCGYWSLERGDADAS